ncbi:phage portal protein [Candidatus Pacearchaeota archaeon]|nr:phage portal protein [Candidatus Pacearchaeota archaeon]
MAPDISKSEVGDMTNDVDNFDVGTASTDGPSDQKETILTNENFPKYLKYYRTISELKSTIRTRAIWVVGKGLIATGEDKKIIDGWRGYGKDTANTLVQNMIMTSYTGGDFFAHIIRKGGAFRKLLQWFGFVNPGKPINIKPLDPASVEVVLNRQGMLEEYRQISKTEGEKNKVIKIEDMFHLPKDRFADEGMGTSVIPAIETIIDSRAEAMADQRTVFHRYVKPLWIWSLDTDDPTKIQEFKAKADATVNTSENIYIPKGAAEAERVSVPQFSTLDPLPYIQDLTDYFYQGTNTPAVIVGTTKGANEASAKVVFLGYEQSVRFDQQWIVDNFRTQLGLKVELEFPTPIEGDIAKDEGKSKPASVVKPNETKVNMKGKR